MPRRRRASSWCTRSRTSSTTKSPKRNSTRSSFGTRWRLAISGGKPSRSDRLSGEGAKGLRSQRGFPLVRVHGGQSREVVDTRRRVVLHSTSKDLVAEQIQQVQDGRANGLPSP